MLEVIVLAAGKGTRMRSDLPKVLHTIANKPFLFHVLERAFELQAEKIHVVIGHGGELVKQQVSEAFNKDIDKIHFIEQTEQLGTGHAVAQALPALSNDSDALILYGDVPLTQVSTFTELLATVSAEAMGLLTVNFDNPTGYGRIVRDQLGAVTKIVEQKDASELELQINEVNSGIMAVPSALLKEWLPKLSNDNAQGEYYLTDIIAMAQDSGITVNASQPSEGYEVLGVNNRLQQAELERIYQSNYAKDLMVQGVSMADPSRFDCRGSLQAGSDCWIDVNCVFEGDNILGNNVSIGPNCTLINAKIGDHTVIKANSIIEDSSLDSRCDIGPFARLRPGSKLKEGAKIGNFVETKKAEIGIGSKVNHLSYVGDAVVGDKVNIGAGTITCNYDGANKHLTQLGDEVFVGSNSALVAPVTVEKGATIGAGSVITNNVGENQLGLTRGKQRNLDGWQRPVKKSKK